MNTSHFINEVKNNQMFYNKKHADYCNKKVKQIVWNKLSKKYNCDAKKRWCMIREKYVRLRSKFLKNNVISGDFKKNFQFQKEMSFLNDHITPKRSHKVGINLKTVKIPEMPEIDRKIKRMSDKTCVVNPSRNGYRDGDKVQNNSEKALLSKHKSLRDSDTLKKSKEDKFVFLLLNKMKKMTRTEKSNFQFDIWKCADEIILKKNLNEI